MASFTTGKKASSAVSSKKSVSSGSFSVQPRATSVSTGKPVTSFSIKPAPSSSFGTKFAGAGGLKYNKPFSQPTPTPTRTIVFKQSPPADITTKVKVFSATLTKSKGAIKKPVPTTSVVSTKSKSSSSSSGGSKAWGGTGSLKSTTSLSSAEKERKGITGSSYTQGASSAPRPAKSYNTGKTETM